MTMLDKEILFEARNHVGGATLNGMIYAIGGQQLQDTASVFKGDVYSALVRDRFLSALPQLKSLFEVRESGLCVRSTRSLIFIGTEVTVDKRVLAMANGVFKILKSE
jgi:hypothetical protein